MNCLIYGAGAIGGYLGGALALTGNQVTFIARPAQAAILNGRGLIVQNTAGARLTHHIRAFTSPAEALEEEKDLYDCLFLAVKSFDTDAAIADLKVIGKPTPTLVCVQNGVDNEPKLAEAFGRWNVIAGTVLTAVANPEPGVVMVEKSRGVGLEDGNLLSKRIAEALQAGGIPTRLYANATAMKWTKLITNLMSNATAAICDLSTAAVYAHPGLYEVEIRMMREALQVMDAKRLPVLPLPRTPTRELNFALRRLPPKLYQPIIQRLVARGRGDKKPSFHQDLSAGKRRTEVSFLNGAIARHAAALGLAAPVNRALTDTLENIVAGGTPWEAYQGKPEKLAEEILTSPLC